MITQENQEKRFLNFIVPSWVDVITYIVLSCLLLFALNASKLWHAFVDKQANAYDTVGSSYTMLNFDNNRLMSFAGDFSVLLFWLAVGSLVYVTIWLTQNSLSEVKHEIGEGQMVSGDMVKRNYLHSLIAHYIFFCALTLLTLISFYFVAGFIFPIVNAAFYGTIITFQQFDVLNIVSGVAAILLLAVILYLLKLLVQIYIRFWRIYIRAQ
jgi:hypothetical protein